MSRRMTALRRPGGGVGDPAEVEGFASGAQDGGDDRRVARESAGRSRGDGDAVLGRGGEVEVQVRQVLRGLQPGVGEQGGEGDGDDELGSGPAVVADLR